MSHVPAKRLTAKRGRINNLPPEITQHILDCLPLENAARTSVLSREWRCRWKLQTQFVLDHRFFCDVLKGKTHILNDVISNVLMRHDGPIQKLDLFVPLDVDLADAFVWVQYALSRPIKTLCLNFHWSFRLPPPDVTFAMVPYTELTHLSLTGCLPVVASRLPKCYGFPRLVSLHISIKGQIVKNLLERLIDECPRLRTLATEELSCQDSGSLALSHALELQVLNLEINRHIWFGDQPTNIKTMRFTLRLPNMSNYYIEEDPIDVHSFLMQIPQIEYIQLRDYFWLNLQQEFTVSRKLPLVLQRLKTVKFYVAWFENNYKNATALALCLVRSAPYLEILKLTYSTRSFKYGPHDDLLEADEDCRHEHLRTVNINGMVRLGMQLQLIKFLLACCTKLEFMSIRHATDEDLA